MKTIPAAIQTVIDGGAFQFGWNAKFTRTDAELSPESGVFRFCSGTRDASITGQTYSAAPGFDISSITCTLGYGVDTLEMTVLTNSDMTRAEFLSGRWYACRVEFNQYNWASPADGFIKWPVYTVSDVTPLQGGFKLELRDLRQFMRQDMSLSTGKTCPHRFGSVGDSMCNKSLVALTHTATVTSVTSRSIFTCSALAQATDYFTLGQVTFDDGLHGGLPLLVRAYTTGGIFTLAVPLIADIVVGQTLVAIKGCLKRREDCIANGNILNFGGQDGVTTQELVGS